MWEKVGDNKYINNIILNSGTCRAFHTEIKNKGKCRKIHSLDSDSNLLFKGLVKYFSKLYQDNNKANISHSFIKGRGPLTNARQHVGFDVTISMDITNFFDSIRPDLVKKYLPEKYIGACFIDGGLPQGFPTSPVLSNIAMIDFDVELQSLLYSFFIKNKESIFKYKVTRYADDIVVSFKFKNGAFPSARDAFNYTELYSDVLLSLENGAFPSARDAFNYTELYSDVQLSVENLMFDYGFSVNKNKTKIQFSHSGQRIVTGVSVGSSGMKATRKMKRKLRAALHQVNVKSSVGIERWIMDCYFNK